jgi:Malectin domain
MFRRSPKLSRLLSYLCDKYFQGRSSEITEYSIALDVLGRDAGFDPQQESVVRVDAHLLRKRLKQYYAGVGNEHQIQIVIPTGRYLPEFALRSELAQSEQTDPEEAAQSSGTAFTEAKTEQPARMAPRWIWAAAALALVALAGWGMAVIGQKESVRRVQAAGSAASVGVFPGALGQSDEIRIAAGDRKHDYVDAVGRTWLSDRYFRGGTTFHRGPAQIQRTRDPELFQNGREGEFVYDIPLHPGVWELHLYFAETAVPNEALRGVSIAINGLPASNLDVASDAGGANIATAKIYKDISPSKDGFLHLMFHGSGPSFLNALEILPGIPGKMRPVRLSTQDTIYRDHLGQVWLPDHGAMGGRKSTRIVPIAGTSDPGLYQWERFGHYNFAIPVVEGGRYTVSLHFSETWFGSPGATGGVGSRVFDVYSNGLTLLKNFDILKEAGGAGSRAVVRVFHDVPASPLGKLDLSFVPVANYALVNAIEVVEQ